MNAKLLQTSILSLQSLKAPAYEFLAAQINLLAWWSRTATTKPTNGESFVSQMIIPAYVPLEVNSGSCIGPRM